MTDKVQKIKDWIGKEQDGLMDAQGNFEYPEHEGAYHILCNLDAYIDSLQEEPKFKTGDRIKPIDSCLGSPRTIVDICDSWYVTDQGTLDFEYEDNWELAEEHKKCMYSKDDYTDEDRKVLCDGCEEECRYAQKEESVGKRFAFKAIPRLLEMIEPTDRAKVYVTKLADALEVEGYSTDAKIVMESLKIMNGEKVPMATMDEEPVSEEFEEALAKEWKGYVDRGAATVDALEDNTQELTFAKGFYRGAKWQKEKLWKPADGDDLPEYDREVIAILDYDFGHYKVVYAHRPNPEGWNGTNIDTGEKEHFEPATYGKGGWNQPHILYWLDARLPYEEK